MDTNPLLPSRKALHVSARPHSSAPESFMYPPAQVYSAYGQHLIAAAVMLTAVQLSLSACKAPGRHTAEPASLTARTSAVLSTVPIRVRLSTKGALPCRPTAIAIGRIAAMRCDNFVSQVAPSTSLVRLAAQVSRAIES